MNDQNPTTRLRIAYVEDDPALVRTLSVLLMQAGMDLHPPVSVETVGISSLESMDEALHDGTQWHAMILDLTIPPYPPEHVLAVAAAKSANWPPFVVLTGGDDDRYRKPSFLSGALGFFFKQNLPFDAPNILRRLVESMWTVRAWQRRALT